MRNVKVAAAIAERLKEHLGDGSEILAIEKLVATTGPGKFAEVFRERSVPEMLEKAEELGIDHCIKKIKRDKEGEITVEFHDGHRSRKLIGEKLGIFKTSEGLDLSKLPPIVVGLISADADTVRKSLIELGKVQEERDG